LSRLLPWMAALFLSTLMTAWIGLLGWLSMHFLFGVI
jgi:hypothetical protein